jgi:hypothetical protein
MSHLVYIIFILYAWGLYTTTGQETQCLLGLYLFNNTECRRCPAKQYNPVPGATSMSTCEPCWKGFYLSDLTCVQCPVGTANEAPFQISASACLTCQVGKYSLEDASRCASCPEGKTSYKGSGTCSFPSNCQAGFYADNGDACTACPDNSTSMAASFSVEQCPCLSGFVRTGTGLPCSPCPVGTVTLGLGVCIDCAVGKYNNLEARVLQCFKCPPNTYANFTGASACVPCPDKTLTPYVSGNDDISDCNCIRGYSPEYAGAACVICPKGTFKPTFGADKCTLCSANRYGTTVGSENDSCQDCPADSSTLPGSTHEDQCLCNVGYGFSWPGPSTRLCTACPVGAYKTHAGNVACSPCAVGSFSNTAGVDMCSLCAVDTFSGTTGARECTPCANGSFTITTGAGMCLQMCSSGTYSTEKYGDSGV